MKGAKSVVETSRTRYSCIAYSEQGGNKIRVKTEMFTGITATK